MGALWELPGSTLGALWELVAVAGILVYEKNNEVWEEDLQIKVSPKDDVERQHAMCHKNPSIIKERGKHLKRFCNGWEDDGQEYYKELLGIFKSHMSCDVWETLQEHLKLYQKKHYARDDNQDDDLGHLKKNVQQVTKMTGK